MFDIGISEIGLIAVVALVVLGPERLPRVARTVGTLLGRAQRYVNDVKAEVNREIELEELKKLQTQMKEAAASVQQSMSSVGNEVHSAVSDVHAGFEQVGKDMSTAAQSIGQSVEGSGDIGSSTTALPSSLGPAGSDGEASGLGATEPSAAGPASYLYEPLQEPPIPSDEIAPLDKMPLADGTPRSAPANAKPLVDPRAAANVRSVTREADVTTATSNATVEPTKPAVRTKRLRDPRAASNATSEAVIATSDAVATSDRAADAAPTDDPDKPVQPSLFR